MNFKNLEKNIISVIKEEQIKLGYRKEVIHLYYPLSSLNNLLHTSYDILGMAKVLTDFSDFTKDRLGNIEVSNNKERFCLTFSETAAEYVHENTPDHGFIYDFIELVSSHDTSIDQIFSLFKKYSEHVHIEKTQFEDFDYLVFFEDGEPDDYLYCLKDEGCHIIYHRFSKDDFDEFDFNITL